MTFYAEPKGNPPVEMTYLVEPANPDPQFRAVWESEAVTNRNLIPKEGIYPGDWKTVWVPFKTNFSVDLGPGDGGRWLWVRFKILNAIKPQSRMEELLIQRTVNWDGHHLAVQSSPPTAAITSPTNDVTSQPMIQLKGYVSSDLGSPLMYEVFDQAGVLKSTGEGLVNDRYHDPVLWAFTTNYFTCYDIDLSQGTNTIVLRGTDEAGFSFTNSFVCVFTTVGDTNPPVFAVESPIIGHQLLGDTFTIRGPCDDPTATMTGEIRGGGETQQLYALIERNGYFWYEHVPLAAGTNYVTLTAKDAAGNVSKTNFLVIGAKDTVLTMDPVEPDSQLWNQYIDVITGRVEPADQTVWINGVQAIVKSDGAWSAKHVPVLSSPSGGTALFNMTAIPPGDLTKGNNSLKELMTIQANLGTNVMTLNASSAACAVFQLHLTGTAGHGFVLEASTNLIEWLPILTNSHPEADFDYTDKNTNNYPCRFFRVVPFGSRQNLAE